MADVTEPTIKRPIKIDRVWAAVAILLLGTAIIVPNEFWSLLRQVLSNLGHTGIFIAFAVILIGYLRASGAEAIVAKAFQGAEIRMIILASLMGGLAPFCSCEVIPFIAALLAMGTPLSAVMAFWLSSPIIDPPMFVITTSALGLDFAIAKTIAAVGFGLLGGLGVKFLVPKRLLVNPLRPTVSSGCNSCCGAKSPFEGTPNWIFWTESERTKLFRETVLENALFLVKWLALAYVIEVLMIRFVPASWIAGALGGDGFQPILMGAVLGGPAYLNGYAAVPLLAGLLDQGMSQGAAMSFILAGSVSCIPAGIAVWALVKPRVFAFYLGFGFVGALTAGVLWQLIA